MTRIRSSSLPQAGHENASVAQRRHRQVASCEHGQPSEGGIGGRKPRSLRRSRLLQRRGDLRHPELLATSLLKCPRQDCCETPSETKKIGKLSPLSSFIFLTLREWRPRSLFLSIQVPPA